MLSRGNCCSPQGVRLLRNSRIRAIAIVRRRNPLRQPIDVRLPSRRKATRTYCTGKGVAVNLTLVQGVVVALLKVVGGTFGKERVVGRARGRARAVRVTDPISKRTSVRGTTAGKIPSRRKIPKILVLEMMIGPPEGQQRVARRLARLRGPKSQRARENVSAPPKVEGVQTLKKGRKMTNRDSAA